jgi:hypothetical protein
VPGAIVMVSVTTTRMAPAAMEGYTFIGFASLNLPGNGNGNNNTATFAVYRKN